MLGRETILFTYDLQEIAFAVSHDDTEQSDFIHNILFLLLKL